MNAASIADEFWQKYNSSENSDARDSDFDSKLKAIAVELGTEPKKILQVAIDFLLKKGGGSIAKSSSASFSLFKKANVISSIGELVKIFKGMKNEQFAAELIGHLRKVDDPKVVGGALENLLREQGAASAVEDLEEMKVIKSQDQGLWESLVEKYKKWKSSTEAADEIVYNPDMRGGARELEAVIRGSLRKHPDSVGRMQEILKAKVGWFFPSQESKLARELVSQYSGSWKEEEIRKIVFNTFDTPREQRAALVNFKKNADRLAAILEHEKGLLGSIQTVFGEGSSTWERAKAAAGMAGNAYMFFPSLLWRMGKIGKALGVAAFIGQGAFVASKINSMYKALDGDGDPSSGPGMFGGPGGESGGPGGPDSSESGDLYTQIVESLKRTYSH